MLIDINKKKTIFKLMNNMSLDSDITIDKFLNSIKNDIDEAELKTKHNIDSVINDFTDVYLKHKEFDSLFNSVTLTIYHIKTLNFETYDTDYNKLYLINGERIQFNCNYINSVNDINNCHKSEHELRGYNVITKKEYLDYTIKYDNLMINLNDIINDTPELH